MSRRSFSVVEVNALIPTLEAEFREIVQLRTLLRREEEKLERAGVHVSRELLVAPGARNPGATSSAGDERSTSAEVREAKARFRGVYEALATPLQRIAALGGEVKDLDMGLVDFACTHGGQEILLCWKLGEKAITHWHAVDAGFASRRALTELPGDGSALES